MGFLNVLGCFPGLAAVRRIRRQFDRSTREGMEKEQRFNEALKFDCFKIDSGNAVYAAGVDDRRMGM